MTRKRSGRAIPKFSSDRAAAEFWSANDSAAYAAHLEEARVTVNPRLRRRIAERAAQKKAITLRLEKQQIERAKLVAQRKSIPYQTLMRMWIAEVSFAKTSSDSLRSAEMRQSVHRSKTPSLVGGRVGRPASLDRRPCTVTPESRWRTGSGRAGRRSCIQVGEPGSRERILAMRRQLAPGSP